MGFLSDFVPSPVADALGDILEPESLVDAAGVIVPEIASAQAAIEQDRSLRRQARQLRRDQDQIIDSGRARRSSRSALAARIRASQRASLGGAGLALEGLGFALGLDTNRQLNLEQEQDVETERRVLARIEEQRRSLREAGSRIRRRGILTSAIGLAKRGAAAATGGVTGGGLGAFQGFASGSIDFGALGNFQRAQASRGRRPFGGGQQPFTSGRLSSGRPRSGFRPSQGPRLNDSQRRIEQGFFDVGSTSLPLGQIF